MSARLRLSGRSAALDLQAQLRPLPPIVLDALGERGQKHEKLAERFGQASSVVISTRRRLDEAERADQQAAKSAIERGVAVPKSKTPKLREQLDEAQREVDAIAELIPASARELLEAAAEVASDVAAQTELAADEAEQRAIDLLRSAQEALAASGELRLQAAWAAELHEDGFVSPWASRPARSKGALVIDDAVRRVEDDREKRIEYVEQLVHERVALNSVPIEGGFRTLDPPPTREELEAARAS